MRDYKVVKVSETVREWVNKHTNSPMVTYKLMVEGESEPVELNQLPDTPAPTVGQEIYGELKTTQYGKQLKKVNKDFDAVPKSTQVTSSSLEPVSVSTNYSRDDSITRQSALKSAVATGETDMEKLLHIADDFLVWLKNEPAKTVEEPLPEPQGEVMDIEGEIDLSDIPF